MIEIDFNLTDPRKLFIKFKLKKKERRENEIIKYFCYGILKRSS
jgi:hypothetical protein